MKTWKIIGVIAATGVSLGAGLWWWFKKRKDKPPGRAEPAEDGAAEEEAEQEPETKGWPTKGELVAKDDLHDALTAELEELFAGAWPPTEEVINELTSEDVVVCAVTSEASGPYENTRQELIQAKVLSVEKTLVRARILGPVAHAEHHGSHAGHGFRVGDLVEVPRSKILVAARDGSPKKTGYGSEGKPAQTFKPSTRTKERYTVRPGTPYDLVLPYRTEELAWYSDRELVTMTHVGARGPLEQVLFSEDSLRGDVSIRALDEDPELGKVLVGRWDFHIDA